MAAISMSDGRARGSGGRKRRTGTRAECSPDTIKCCWALVCATGTPPAARPVLQRITPTGFGLVSGQRSNDRASVSAEPAPSDEVGEPDLLPAPLDFPGCRRRVSGEDGQ